MIQRRIDRDEAWRAVVNLALLRPTIAYCLLSLLIKTAGSSNGNSRGKDHCVSHSSYGKFVGGA